MQTCLLCNRETEFIHSHHICPVAWGGIDDPRNLIDICESCHNTLHAQAREDIKYTNHLKKGEKITKMNFIKQILDIYPESAIQTYVDIAVTAYFNYQSAKSRGYLCDSIDKRTLLTFKEHDLHKLQYFRKIHKFKSIEDYIIWLVSKVEGV